LLLNQGKQALGCFVVSRTSQVVVEAIVVIPAKVQVNKFEIRQLPVLSYRERAKFFTMRVAVKDDDAFIFQFVMSTECVDEILVVFREIFCFSMEQELVEA